MLQAAAVAGTQPGATDGCKRIPQDEIVVCGSRSGESPYRLPKLPEKYARKPIRAETDAIPGVHTRVHVQSEGMPDGNVSKRLMVTFSLPF
ncbi:MAG TPA: hypothetical protein VGQ34_11200 [Sphingomicrobium sp.]|nr:hypothetical protein [Sphingomicrobium sp.]